MIISTPTHFLIQKVDFKRHARTARPFSLHYILSEQLCHRQRKTGRSRETGSTFIVRRCGPSRPRGPELRPAVRGEPGRHGTWRPEARSPEQWVLGAPKHAARSSGCSAPRSARPGAVGARRLLAAHFMFCLTHLSLHSSKHLPFIL